MGRTPKRLDALVPADLPAIPDDPFALKGPPKYRLIGGRYLLDSVGPDGKDDGGKPICSTNSRGQLSYIVNGEESKGDWVSGVNR